MNWITDSHGNRCSTEKWGSEDAAREALATLKDCSGCSDCYDCYGCSGCYGCYRCSGCSSCSDCSVCSRCSNCSRCFGCSDRSGCSNCSNCSVCSECYDSQNARPETIGGLVVPVIENIHQRVYDAASQPVALNMDNWHTCDTTHCRAGWVTHLAGEPGKALEEATSPLFAAQQIYLASGYAISPVRFFDTNEAALADMKRLKQLRKDFGYLGWCKIACANECGLTETGLKMLEKWKSIVAEPVPAGSLF